MTRDSQVLARDRFAQVDEILRSNNAEDAVPGLLYIKKFLSNEQVYALCSNRVNFEYLIVCKNTRLSIWSCLSKKMQRSMLNVNFSISVKVNAINLFPDEHHGDDV